MKEDYALLYGPLHRKGSWFYGYSVRNYWAQIKSLIDETGSTRILDYGPGKGKQYTEKRLHEKWGVPMPHCFDVGVKKFSARPEGTFDGVICCDVMEHIHEYDVSEVLRDVFSFSDK